MRYKIKNNNLIYPVLVALDDSDQSKGEVIVPLSSELRTEFLNYISDRHISNLEAADKNADEIAWMPVYRKSVVENGLPRAVNVHSSKAMNSFFEMLTTPLNLPT
jgi:hypothetical protein